MKYYRVKQAYDGRYNITGKIELIAGELYTSREMEKLHIRKYMCDVVEIPKSKIYWSFGGRFERGHYTGFQKMENII